MNMKIETAECRPGAFLFLVIVSMFKAVVVVAAVVVVVISTYVTLANVV